MKRYQLAMLALASVSLLLASCTSKEPESKKKDPTAFSTHEEQSVDSRLILSQKELNELPSEQSMAKVLMMPQRVIAKLLDADHKMDSKLYHSVVIIDPTNPDQQNSSASGLWEEQHLSWRASDGAFYLQFVPQSRNGLELIWTKPVLYMHMGQGPWRKEVSDGRETFYLEKATSARERFYRLFRGHIKFSKIGEETYQGKQVIKVALSLDEKGHKPMEQLPITTATKDKFRLNIKATNRSIENERPRIATIKKLDGEMLIDKRTGVPLKGWMEATYLENIRNDKQAEMSMRYEFAYSDIGMPVQIKPPDKDPEAPEGSVLQEDTRRRWVPKAIFKDMPKDLRKKSGVDKPRRVLPEDTQNPKTPKKDKKDSKTKQDEKQQGAGE